MWHKMLNQREESSTIEEPEDFDGQLEIQENVPDDIRLEPHNDVEFQIVSRKDGSFRVWKFAKDNTQSYHHTLFCYM